MSPAPPESVCIYYPTKEVYATADEASCALREVAVLYMEQGRYDPRLRPYECHGHWHLGRSKDERASA